MCDSYQICFDMKSIWLNTNQAMLCTLRSINFILWHPRDSINTTTKNDIYWTFCKKKETPWIQIFCIQIKFVLTAGGKCPFDRSKRTSPYLFLNDIPNINAFQNTLSCASVFLENHFHEHSHFMSGKGIIFSGEKNCIRIKEGKKGLYLVEKNMEKIAEVGKKRNWILFGGEK